MRPTWWVVSLTACSAATTKAAPAAWTHLAHDASRIARVSAAPVDLSAPAWVAAVDINGSSISFRGSSTPVVWGRSVFALGRSAGLDHLYCIDRSTGATLWQRELDAAQAESWASPCIDTIRGTVIAPSGNDLACFDTLDGAHRWTHTFALPLVNASPLVTNDRGPADRCFITDYTGFGVGARLHCINVSSFDAALNPFQPGELVWSTLINGFAATGSTCAYDGSRVYVAHAGRYAPPLPGQVMAFDAGAASPPAPVWITTNPVNEGFAGGVAVEQGIVFAASYAFFGALASATTLELDAATGVIVSCTPSNHSASIPIPFDIAGADRTVLSTGLAGFGSRPALELFAPSSPLCSDTLIWETSSATWIDDGDALIELGEFDVIGGWNHQPVIIETPTGDTLMYIGEMPTFPGALADEPYVSLWLVDLSRTPAPDNATGFIVQRFIGCGSSPSLAGRNLYSTGAAGLHAFGPPPSVLDVNGDHTDSIDDLYGWEIGNGIGGRLDVDRSLVVDLQDQQALRTGLRSDELADMLP